MIFLAAALFAAAPAKADDDLLEHVIVTATRRSTDMTEIAAAISTVDSETVISHKLATDALQSLPGVYLQQTTPGQGAAIVRGLKGSAILHLVDGMRLSNAMFRTAPTPWFALVPTTSVERLEIIRGTPASLYGSEAVGGVVQSVSRMPEFDSEEISYKRDLQIGFDTAELQQSIRATLDFGTQRLATSVSAEYLETGDRRTGGGERIGPSGYTSKALRTVVHGTPNDYRSWFIDLHFLEQPKTPRVDELVAGFDQDEPSSSEFFFEPNQRFFAHVQHDLDSPSGLDWKFDAAWQRVVDDRTTRNFGAVERRYESNKSDLYGLTLNVSGDANTLSWIAGVDLYYDEVSSSRNAENIINGTIAVLAPRFPDGATVRQAGLFTNLNWYAADRHAISTGIRYNDVRIELPDGTTISPGRMSGDVGWIFNVSDTWQLVANLGAGFRAPNIADLGTLGSRPGNRFNIPNTDLGSENVTHGDVGLRHISANWRFELVVFKLNYDDRITSVSTGNATPDGRDIVQSVNAASSSIVGVETGLTAFLTPQIRLEAMLNYSRGDQQVADTEEPADRVPPLNGRITLTYDRDDRWQFESWLVAAAAQNRLSARDLRDVRINPTGTPGWARLGASATWRNEAGWQISSGVDNVLDKNYRTHGSGIDAPGRNFYVNVRRLW
jgi:outer membrane receptor for ferrienterochelin and colicin